MERRASIEGYEARSASDALHDEEVPSYDGEQDRVSALVARRVACLIDWVETERVSASATKRQTETRYSLFAPMIDEVCTAMLYSLNGEEEVRYRERTDCGRPRGTGGTHEAENVRVRTLPASLEHHVTCTECAYCRIGSLAFTSPVKQ